MWLDFPYVRAALPVTTAPGRAVLARHHPEYAESYRCGSHAAPLPGCNPLAPGFLFGLLVGSNEFSGEADGTSFTATAFGSNGVKQGNCNYTTDAIIAGTIDGDDIDGTIRASGQQRARSAAHRSARC